MSIDDALNETTDIRNGKISLCYGCGQELYTYSMLICAECLDNKCEEFRKLTSNKNIIRKKK